MNTVFKKLRAFTIASMLFCRSVTMTQIQHRAYTKYIDYNPKEASVKETLSDLFVTKEAMNLATCAAACSTESGATVFKFDEASNNCLCLGSPIFIVHNTISDYPDEVLYYHGSLAVENRKLLLRQREGHYFAQCSGSLDCHPNDPDNGAFSIASTTEDYRAADGYFYFDLCYVDLFDGECFQFKQKNEPFTTTVRDSFEVIYSPLSDLSFFSGLANDSPNTCLADGEVGGNFRFSVGMLKEYTASKPLPGPGSPANVVMATKETQLYARMP